MRIKGISDQGIKRIAQDEKGHVYDEEERVELAGDIWTSVLYELIEYHTPILFKEFFEHHGLTPDERVDVVEIIKDQFLPDQDSAKEVMENFFNALEKMAI